MADVVQKTKWDAVLVPNQYPPDKSGPARLVALKLEFAAELGSQRVHAQHVDGGMDMLVARPTHRYQPDGHPDAGQDRFDWLDRGDGVFFGLLTDAAKLTDADREKAHAEKTGDAKTRRQEELLARFDELSAIPTADLMPDQTSELARLTRFIPAMYPERRVKPPASPATGSIPEPATMPGTLVSGPSEANQGPGSVAPVPDDPAKAAEAASGGQV